MIRRITDVLIYHGHGTNLSGPYLHNIKTRIQTFQHLSALRARTWNVIPVKGEELIGALSSKDPRSTLLVIPAGQSTQFDRAFTTDQAQFIHDFIFRGGGAYLTCGSAYWASAERRFHGVCREQPQHPKTLIKKSILPLFEGVAEGPLCPHPAAIYNEGFYSDAVRVHIEGQEECTVLLSGGGSFKFVGTAQKMKVLARYPHEELMRLGKTKEECAEWENAAVMTSVGEGAALMAMFHPYYGKKGPQEIDVEAYERAFPHCKTNWREVNDRLSPLDLRMRCLLKLISELENREFRIA